MPNIIDLRKTITAKEKESAPAKEEPKQLLPNQIEWTAPEFEAQQKQPGWYLTGAIIALLLMAIALFLKNLFLGLIIVLASLAIFIYSRKKPNQITFKITGQGVLVDKTLYPYSNLKSFWIFYDPPDKKYLSLESEKALIPYIKIPLGDQDPLILRKFLIKFIPEKQQEESLVDIIARRLKF